jgi:hypothetical protein
MREQRFFQGQWSVVAQSLPPNPNLTGIQINWTEEPVKTIKIQLRPIETATKNCCINLKFSCRQGYDVQFALVAQAQKIFVSGSGRPRV